MVDEQVLLKHMGSLIEHIKLGTKKEKTYLTLFIQRQKESYIMPQNKKTGCD